MLEQVSPSNREIIIECRCLAIQGEKKTAINRLDNSIESSQSSPALDLIALYLLKCELLHLDACDEEAFNVIENDIHPLISNVPESVEYSVAWNRSEIAFALFKVDDFYAFVDQSRIAGIELWDYEGMHFASESSTAGKNYESLPAIWRELYRTYLQGCWRPYRSVCQQMAIERLKTGFPVDAVYHAIMSLNKKTAERVGDYLLSHGSTEALKLAVEKLLLCSHLRRHFVIACKLLHRIIDAIPDFQIESILRWLLLYATDYAPNNYERNSHDIAWETLRLLSYRFNTDQAKVLAESATGHELWDAISDTPKVFFPIRKEMIGAAGGCISALPKGDLENLVEKTLPLATEKKQDYDYGEVINLLYRIASKSDEAIKQRIRESLYPPGKNLDAILLHVASFFGQDISDSESLSKTAITVAEHVKKQVQFVDDESDLEQIPESYMHSTNDLGSKKLIVHLVDTQSVQAVLKYRDKLTEDSLNVLINVILEMVEERENFLSNKISLIQAIHDIGDSCCDETANKIFDKLLPLAQGEIIESDYRPPASEANNPLNPYKINDGTPSQLQGVALYALACIEREKPEIYGKKLNNLIDDALSNTDPEVRASGFSAAREKPSLSDSTIYALILGTRDAHQEVAYSAFEAIASKQELKLKRAQIHLLIYSIKLAALSASVKVRKYAAYTTTTLLQQKPKGQIKKKLIELNNIFLDDTCYSVRKEASQL